MAPPLRKYYAKFKRRGLLVSLRFVRGYCLFIFSYVLRKICPFENNIKLAKNVRLQKNSSLMAEAPEAQINVGENTIVYEFAKIEAYNQGKITIGNNCILGDVKLYCRQQITIGDFCLFSWGVLIQDFDPHPTAAVARQEQVGQMVSSFQPSFLPQSEAIKPIEPKVEWEFPKKEIKIGDNVWIGANAIILKGAKIGDGSIVAAGAVVASGDYPERSLIAGNPAKIIKSLDL